MRYWLTVFLLVLMPLQSVWAAAGSYCQHENDAAAQHIGHHEHRHEAGAAHDNHAKAKASFALDADCGFCHACCSIVIARTPGLPGISSTALKFNRYLGGGASFLAPPPDRPNWLPLV